MSNVSIETWIPQRWDHVVGNEDLVEHYQETLRMMLDWEKTGMSAWNRKGPSTMVLGNSRSGKTAVTKLFVQSLICEKLDVNTLNPCCLCGPCRRNVARFGEEGLFTDAVCGKVHYVPVDCANVTADEINNLIIRLRDYAGIRVVYLDEVHRLHRPNSFLEEKLLKPVHETNGMWIASSIRPEGLEKQFLGRFTIIYTALPQEDTLALWLSSRCKDWGIARESEETFSRLAERANCVPGMALQVLARAYRKSPRFLALKLVEQHVFEA